MARWRHEEAFNELIEAAAQKYQVPPALVKGVIAQESAFRPEAYREEPRISDASRGLMQVLERTARGLGFKGDPGLLFDPVVNIDLGTKLLAQNFRQARGNWDVALSAYNAGFSRDRPWDAKRYTEDPTHPEYGRMINEDYVKRVQGNRTYFTIGVVGGTGAALVVALVAGWWLLRSRGLG